MTKEVYYYGRIYLLGLPFLMLYDVSSQIVTSCRVPLLAPSVLNIILDLVLVGSLGAAEFDGIACSNKLPILMIMPICGLDQSLAVFIAQNGLVGAISRVQSSIQITRSLILAYISAVVLPCLLPSRQLLFLLTDGREPARRHASGYDLGKIQWIQHDGSYH